jgi:hypothetical protein
MLRLIASFLLSLVFAYGIAQNNNLEVISTLNTQYNLNPQGDKVMVVTYQRDAGAPVVVAWQSNDPKATLKGHSYSIAAAQSSRRTHLDLFGAAPHADASVMWISNKNFDEITKGKTAFELNGDKAATSFVVTGKEDYVLYYNGKELKVPAYHLKSVGTEKDKELELWVLDNAKNPIVLQATGLYNFNLTDASSSDQ